MDSLFGESSSFTFHSDVRHEASTSAANTHGRGVDIVNTLRSSTAAPAHTTPAMYTRNPDGNSRNARKADIFRYDSGQITGSHVPELPHTTVSPAVLPHTTVSPAVLPHTTVSASELSPHITVSSSLVAHTRPEQFAPSQLTPQTTLVVVTALHPAPVPPSSGAPHSAVVCHTVDADSSTGRSTRSLPQMTCWLHSAGAGERLSGGALNASARSTAPLASRKPAPCASAACPSYCCAVN